MSGDRYSLYQNKVRVRVAGLLQRSDKILLVKLHSPVIDHEIWLPPGGGVEFGESLHQAVKREFKEETGLIISVGKLRHINELIEGKFHALEFFFDVFAEDDAEFAMGIDPEHGPDDQILRDIHFFSQNELTQLFVKPDFILHQYWEGKSVLM